MNFNYFLNVFQIKISVNNFTQLKLKIAFKKLKLIFENIKVRPGNIWLVYSGLGKDSKLNNCLNDLIFSLGPGLVVFLWFCCLTANVIGFLSYFSPECFIRCHYCRSLLRCLQ